MKLNCEVPRSGDSGRFVTCRVQEERSTTCGLAKAQESGEVPWLMTSAVGVAAMQCGYIRGITKR